MLRSTIALAALSLGLVGAPAVVVAQAAAPAESAASAQAAPQGHHHRHPLLRGITLSADQKAQFKAIHAKYHPQFKEARAANDRQTMRQLRHQMISEARGVLTPDQQKQFDSNLAALKARRKAASQQPAPSSDAPSESAPAPSPTS
jgi:Spy/CpxP family protein refolding chaperone